MASTSRKFSTQGNLLLVVATLASLCASGAHADLTVVNNCLLPVSVYITPSILSPAVCIGPLAHLDEFVSPVISLVSVAAGIKLNIDGIEYLLSNLDLLKLIGVVKIVINCDGPPCGHGKISVSAYTNLLGLIKLSARICIKI